MVMKTFTRERLKALVTFVSLFIYDLTFKFLVFHSSLILTLGSGFGLNLKLGFGLGSELCLWPRWCYG